MTAVGGFVTIDRLDERDRCARKLPFSQSSLPALTRRLRPGSAASASRRLLPFPNAPWEGRTSRDPKPNTQHQSAVCRSLSLRANLRYNKEQAGRVYAMGGISECLV
jgi:hypothetical protein